MTNLEGLFWEVKQADLNTTTQVSPLTSYPQTPVALARSPRPLLARVRGHHSEVLHLCWRTLKSLLRSVQNIARWCVCKLFLRNSLRVQMCNPTESMAQSRGRGGGAGLQRWGCTCSVDGHGHPFFCKLTHKLVFTYTPKTRGELPQTCKGDRRKRGTFPQNVIMYKSCVQVWVSLTNSVYEPWGLSHYTGFCFLSHRKQSSSSRWARVQLWERDIRWLSYWRFRPT